ncbi:rolling circle replication-associated protein [Bacillus subtilis]|uniref:rolling circle replication-associated protein n=1 Tax=Bacillus subtilis TaxID=1423 RepID=UPI003F742E70
MDVSSTNRADNLKSVKVTMRNLRRLITHNFHGGNKELWVTLTYRWLTKNPEIAYQDFKRFIRKLRKDYGHLEYIAVIEPQATGNWHFHVLLKTTDHRVLRIPNEILAKAWGQGFTKTKRLKNKDKMGNYVLAYVTNLDIPSTDKDSEKKYVKGARLHLYPKGVRIYRCSRGIEKPIEMTGSKDEILELNGVIKSKADFSRKTIHETISGQEIVYITEFYNDIGKKLMGGDA